MNQEDFDRILEDYLNERGLYHDFIDFAYTKGYEYEELPVFLQDE